MHWFFFLFSNKIVNWIKEWLHVIRIPEILRLYFPAQVHTVSMTKWKNPNINSFREILDRLSPNIARTNHCWIIQSCQGNRCIVWSTKTSGTLHISATHSFTIKYTYQQLKLLVLIMFLVQSIHACSSLFLFRDLEF